MEKIPIFFILDEDHRTPKGATPEEYMEWASADGNVVASIVAQETIGDKWISTVFITARMVDPNMHFETGIFTDEGRFIEIHGRYATWDEAEKGHQECADKVRKGLS